MEISTIKKKKKKKKKKIKIIVDNNACIEISQNINSKGHCKHIDTRYKFIQEEIK